MSIDASGNRVGYIYQDEYPWDIRVDKITGSLADAGYETVIISRNRSGLAVRENLRPGLDVRRLPGPAIGFIRTLLNFPAFFSPVWIWTIYKAVKVRKLRLLIVRDLPLSPAAWLVGRICNVPVIMDMAENYPAMIQDTWDHRGPDRFDFLLRNPSILRMQERWVMPRLDGVMAVSAASQDRVRSIEGVKHDNVWVIENTPILKDAGRVVECELSQKMHSISGLKLLYVGGLEESRGLMVVVEALSEVLKHITSVTLIVVGEGTSRKSLERRAVELNLTSNIIFAGWIEQAYVPSIIAEADICLVPHLVTEHIETTVPNKIYDYMAQSKPVLVTHSKSLRAIVESCKCGHWYDDKNSEALAGAIESMENKSQREQLGARGKLAVEQKLNWSEDAKQLIEIVNQVMSTDGSSV